MRCRRNIFLASSGQKEEISYYHYQNELPIWHTNEDAASIKVQLKDEVLIAHDGYLNAQRRWYDQWAHTCNLYRGYPYLRYKKQLQSDIAAAKLHHQRICWHNPPIAQCLYEIIHDLQTISRYIVTLDQYQKEYRAYEQEKRKAEEQRELAYLLDKQNRYLEEQNKLLKDKTAEHKTRVAPRAHGQPVRRHDDIEEDIKPPAYAIEA